MTTNTKKIAKANEDKLRQFNDSASNSKGETIQVILLTAEQHSEGINLFNVRRPWVLLARKCHPEPASFWVISAPAILDHVGPSYNNA